MNFPPLTRFPSFLSCLMHVDNCDEMRWEEREIWNLKKFMVKALWYDKIGSDRRIFNSTAHCCHDIPRALGGKDVKTFSTSVASLTISCSTACVWKENDKKSSELNAMYRVRVNRLHEQFRCHKRRSSNISSVCPTMASAIKYSNRLSAFEYTCPKYHIC